MAVFGVVLALGAGCAGTNPGASSPPSETSAAPAKARETTPAPTPTPAAQAAPSSGTLAGTTWRAADAGAAAFSGSTPTLTFDSAQHAAGSTGCNRFSGTVTIEGRSLRFGPLMTTRRGCPGPVMEQEKRFLGALEACRSWRKSAAAAGGQEGLELLDESGAVALRLEPAPAN